MFLDIFSLANKEGFQISEKSDLINFIESSTFRKMKRPTEVVINYSGEHGRPGDHGYKGSDGACSRSGCSGTNGTAGTLGLQARPINVSIFSDDRTIKISEVAGPRYELDMGNSLNGLKLYANGGRGGDGGRGGNGGHGGHGFPGEDATRNCSGGNGGPGGNGGDGGDGGDGGHGGHAGSINLSVKDEDTDLLMIILDHQQIGGQGGSGGAGGNGGSGGPGGIGGSSYSWTTTEVWSDQYGNNRNERTHYHTNPGGYSGPPGRDGRDGRYGNRGRDGSHANYQISVNIDGTMQIYKEKYWLKVMGFELVPSDDVIYEPGESVFIRGLRVFNCGFMPTPRWQDVLAIITSNDWIKFDREDALKLPKSLKEQQIHQFNSDIRYSISDFGKSAIDHTFFRIEEIIPINLVTRVISGPRSFAKYKFDGRLNSPSSSGQEPSIGRKRPPFLLRSGTFPHVKLGKMTKFNTPGF